MEATPRSYQATPVILGPAAGDTTGSGQATRPDTPAKGQLVACPRTNPVGRTSPFGAEPDTEPPLSREGLQSRPSLLLRVIRKEEPAGTNRALSWHTGTIRRCPCGRRFKSCQPDYLVASHAPQAPATEPDAMRHEGRCGVMQGWGFAASTLSWRSPASASTSREATWSPDRPKAGHCPCSTAGRSFG